MHMALIYAEEGLPAYYLGSITMNGTMTISEMLDLIGLDDDGIAGFVQAQGWDGFDLCMVRCVSINGSAEMERGEELPECRIVLDTSEGLRYIDAPAVAGMDVWQTIGLYDDIYGSSIYDNYDEMHAWPDDGAYGSLSPWDGEEQREAEE